MVKFIPIHWIILGFLFACGASENRPGEGMDRFESTLGNAESASVTGVTVSGNESAYTFSVTVSSPDTGCKQYADWWEVVDTQEKLVYRRILAHSHVDEQPFTRSGGPVRIQKNTEIYIRVHMNNSGFGASMLKGTVENGFTPIVLEDFAPELAAVAPLPRGCAF